VKVEEPRTAVPAARRHIIRRPRLTRLLDESGARIILLVAPAGYGKTTLAQEWLDDPSRRAAWYRGGPASADVAALAVGLTEAAATVVPHAGARLRQRLKATDRPDEDVHVLAEMLQDDLAKWPDDAWLVIDDYQFATGRVAPETFVGKIAETPSLRMLITSRRRPGWAEAKRRAYGEMVEIDRTDLAMTDDEVRMVLDIEADGDRSEFLSRTAGWPVIVGIAALTGNLGGRDESVPRSLLDYFAEELYQTAPELQWTFCQLAIPPALPRDLAEKLLGEKAASRAIEEATTLGLFAPNSVDTFEIHPLLRRFLHEKLPEHPRDRVEETVTAIGRFFIDAQQWDEAFEVISTFENAPLLNELVRAGLEDVLGKGRTATVQRWIEFAADRYLASPLFDLAEAELAFRQGSYPKTRLLGEQAARGLQADMENELAAVAYARAGRAAHLEGRGGDATKDHEMALALTTNRETAREALWGQFNALVERGNIDAAEAALARLEGLDDGRIDDVFRLRSGRYVVSRQSGRPSDVTPLVEALPLLDRSTNPMVRSSFLNICTGALALEARYEEAERVATQQISDSELYRLDFALSHGHLRRSAALCGMRRYREAFQDLDRAERLAAGLDHGWVTTATAINRGLTLLATQRFDDAWREVEAEREGSGGGLRAEYLAFRALAMACLGKTEEANRYVALAEKGSRALEVKTICSFARVVGSHRDHRADADRASVKAFDRAVRDRAVDYFVISYRACPELLESVAATGDPRLGPILHRARDQDMARRVGVVVPNPRRPKGVLSPREREVWELLALGLSNREIAHRLFLSESTVKVHTRHIFEKLGAKTRVEAVVKGQELLGA
jgi:LuxR family transcriptional regulator, maltose regulon positive regulatory protein